MNNHLYITYSSSQDLLINQNEWMSFVKEDDELEICDDQNTVNYFGQKLYWSKGKVYTTDPGMLLLLKMQEIASFFNADLCGDDGRVYILPTCYYYPEGITKPMTAPPVLKFERQFQRPWIKRLLGI